MASPYPFFNPRMTPPGSNPFRRDDSLDWPITEEQRQRSEEFLQECYADGRIDLLDFEQRVGIVLSARTRGELNPAFNGLARVPLHSQAVATAPSRRGRPVVSAEAQRVGGALMHFSALIPPYVIIPAIGYALSPRGSALNQQAARAFNAAAVGGIGMILLTILGGITGVHWPLSVFFTLYMVTTIITGVRATQDPQARNPLTRIVPLRILSEGPRQARELPR